MPTIEDRIRFATAYIRNKEGVAWSLKGRAWVRDEFWRAATGFKLWTPRSGKEVCGECKPLVGSLLEHPADNDTHTRQHRATGCPGLEVYPVLFVGLNLKRQDGKTFNTMAFALAEMGIGTNVSIALTAASEDQVKALFDENYRQAIESNAKLAKHFRVVGMKIYADKRNGMLEAVATSHKSATGRTRRYVLIDEAKDVPDRVADAVIHAVEAMSGIECPYGHVSRLDAEAADRALNAQRKEKCRTCSAVLQPFFGRVIATSSSGLLEEDSRSQWFGQLIAQQLGTSEADFGEELPSPSPYAHVFASDAPLNPAKSNAMQDGLRSVFGGLPAMRELTEAAMGTRWVRKGEDFISKQELDRCVDSSLVNLLECSTPAVGFLDTSVNVDKTSLVILAEDTERSSAPWERVFVARLDVWDPSHLPGGVIDPASVETHLVALLPLFTGLRALHVDTRGMQWAQLLVKKLKRPLQPWDKSTSHESVAGWNSLQQRVRAGTIRLPNNAEMRREFRGVQLKPTSDGVKVVDRERRKSHKDITEALALCCYLAAKQQEAPTGPTLSTLHKRSKVLAGRREFRPLSRGFGTDSL